MFYLLSTMFLIIVIIFADWVAAKFSEFYHYYWLMCSLLICGGVAGMVLINFLIPAPTYLSDSIPPEFIISIMVFVFGCLLMMIGVAVSVVKSVYNYIKMLVA